MANIRKLGTGIKKIWRRSSVSGYHAQCIIVLLSTCATVFFLFPFETTFQTFNLPQVGEAAKETVIAPFTFDIMKPPDQLAREQQAAADKVLLVLDLDSGRSRKVNDAFAELKKNLSLLSSRRASDSTIKRVRRDLVKALSENAIKALLKRPDLIDSTASQADKLLEKGIITAASRPVR